MFCTKTKKEQLQDHSATVADTVADTAAIVAEQLRERVVPAVGQAAETALEWSQPRVEAAREWARPRVEHGIEVAAPKLESAVSGLAPKVDTARDKIVDELLPRIADTIAAWAAASTAAKDEAVSRGQGAAAVIAGDAVASPKGRKGRVFLVLSVLAASAAGVVAFMKRSAPKDDPWTTPLADPYVPASNGQHSHVAPVESGIEVAAAGSEIIADPNETVAPSPVDSATDADPAERKATEQD